MISSFKILTSKAPSPIVILPNIVKENDTICTFGYPSSLTAFAFHAPVFASKPQRDCKRLPGEKRVSAPTR